MPGEVYSMGQSGQSITGQKDMKKLTGILAGIDPFRQSGCGLRDLP